MGEKEKESREKQKRTDNKEKNKEEWSLCWLSWQVNNHHLTGGSALIHWSALSALDKVALINRRSFKSFIYVSHFSAFKLSNEWTLNSDARSTLKNEAG